MEIQSKRFHPYLIHGVSQKLVQLNLKILSGSHWVLSSCQFKVKLIIRVAGIVVVTGDNSKDIEGHQQNIMKCAHVHKMSQVVSNCLIEN